MYAQDEAVIVIATFGFWAVVSLVTLLLTLMYLSSLSRALAKCGKTRRTLDPGLVWLNLIPLFHLFWKFWTAAQVGSSLRREFDARGLRTGFTFGQPVGVLVPVVAIFTRFVFWLGSYLTARMGEGDLGMLVTLVTVLLGVIELVLLVVHWTQINGYVRQLAATRPPATEAVATADDGGGARDFDEDYRPIPRRRRPADRG